MNTISTMRGHCPAKVNLALSVARPRPDGMHPLCSWMVALRFGDDLTLARVEGQSRFDLAFAADAPLRGVVDWPLHKDLVYRAHQRVEAMAGRPLPVHLTLRKRIPAGAGLGGGSSNAAATIVGLNRLYELGLTEAAMMGIGQELGSDVGFLIAAILGRPSALVGGLGERLEPLPLPSAIHLVLIFPGFGCPTGEVYRALDQQSTPTPLEPDEPRVRRLASAPLADDGLFNDLGQAACHVRPELARCRNRIVQHCGRPVHITGSGSTLFMLTSDQQAGETLAQSIRNELGLAAVVTSSG